MKKYFIYLIIYSIGGFLLERIINLIAYGRWYDNSILIGPYQPLYGSGIVMAIIVYDFYINKKIKNINIKNILLIIVAILATGLSEAVTGYGFEYLYGVVLWNYGEFLPCQLYYVCYIPTTLFGIGSYLVIKFIHPNIVKYVKLIPNYLYYLLITIFGLDIIITFFLLN